ncbi:lipid-binding SYLF domain-containing protein [Maridesulfovibrio frigidus]|uniref:lipid-binding SYLF domain-containing protein n=1 Tax=Maridesulfovibrio frigidus TaxID=340956 RepID=UPI0004E1CF5D|nr:lipid-binding SYLF domain-containing protein [Maridesulfovibrio frigidus]
MNKWKGLILCIAMTMLLSACNSVKNITGSPCVSNSTTSTQMLVDSAACAIKQMRTNQYGPTIDYLLEISRAVFIFPDVYKMAFMIGAEGGTGVLCAKDNTGFWNGPVFYSMTGLDIGVQGGIASKTVMIFLLDDEALESALTGKLDMSLGADLAIGRLSDQSHRGLFDMEGNMYTVVYQAGAFGGMTFHAGALMVSKDSNNAYYGKRVEVRELLMTHEYDNMDADILLNALVGI